MKIKITAFGYLAETLGKSQFEMENISDVYSLKKEIENNFPEIKNIEYKIAVNKELVNENILLNENSEVVLLPPFAGG